MKISVAVTDGQVAHHFGHCDEFMMFETKGDSIVSIESIPNPGHKPGFLPNFLGDHGAEVIIAGGMGGGAVDIFNERNIEVIIGAEGLPQKNVELYLKGQLQSTGSVCHEHDHEH